MMRTVLSRMKLAAFAFVVSLGAAPVVAAPITISYTTFGTLSGATFGGSGIPNDAVAITTIVDGANTITLGLTATERYSNPAVGDDGAGTFYATTGANTGDPSDPLAPPNLLGATWNFGFYIDIDGGGTFADYSFDLLYDLDQGFNTDEASLVTVNLNSLVPVPSGTTLVQGSENLLFAGPPFDAFATGQYSFALRAYELNGTAPRTFLDDSAIQVEVAVPEPSTLTLLGIGGIAALARRRRGTKDSE